MQSQVDAAVATAHTFGGQALDLFAECAAAGRKRNAPIGAQHAMPGQPDTRRRFTKDTTDQPGAPRQTGAARDFTVTGDFAWRNGSDRGADGGVFRRDCGPD